MSNEACLNDVPAVAAGPAHTSLARLSEALEQLCSIASEQEDRVVLNGCEELRTKLSEHELNIVVVGQYKRGKTSFLNALIGKPLLPVAVLPLTSIVTVLRYGDKPRAAVYFHNGEKRPSTLEEVAGYVTEAGNPHNEKGVDRVEVFYPSEYLHRGVRLIDTPGIGSVYEHNTEVTYGFVSRIDAAIFVTSPDPPVTPTELELLSGIIGQVPKVFLILNKTDLLDDQQRREVLDFVRRNLPKQAASLPVVPVSAKLAIEARRNGDADMQRRSGFPVLEEELRRFLREESEDVFLRATERRLKLLISELELRQKLEIQAILTPINELRDRFQTLNEELETALRQEQENQFLMQGHLARLRERVRDTAAEFAAAQAGPVREEMLRRLREFRTLPRKRVAAEVDVALRKEIESRFDAWLPGVEQEALNRLREATDRFKTAINDLIRRVCQTTGTLFGIELTGLEGEVELAMVRSEGYHTDSILTWGLGSFPLLLPGPLYEQYLRRELLRRVPEELDRNANRRSYDLSRRLERSAAAFRAAMKERLEETVERIRDAIQSALRLQAEGEKPANEAVERLRAVLNRLERLRSGLIIERPRAEDVHG